MLTSSSRAALVCIGLVVLVPMLFGAWPSSAQPATTHRVYLPLVNRLQMMPFGVETTRGWMANATVSDSARRLGVTWWRRNAISWRLVQPARGAPYDISALASFDRDLQAALAVRLTPVVVINDSPSWATINQPVATSCGAIRADRFADFAAFMSWLAARYKGKVTYWELGNEPDIDPSLVSINQVFGCWGDRTQPYYGGEHYGNMLKVVAPAIKRADPHARVVIGGLSLIYPVSTTASHGHPERFFEGVLRAGAGSSFDVVAYHSYPAYTNQPLDYDYDRDPQSAWASVGGYTIGKAKFLRDTMARYRVDKPLFLNETALTCPQPPDGICAIGPTFYQAQSDYAVRMITRAWSIGVQQIAWYTLQGPGWFDSGLLDSQQRPRPVYQAYQQYIAMTNPSDPPVQIHDYDRSDVAVEAFRFNKPTMIVDVVWSKNLSTYYITLPQRFIKAYGQYGAEVQPIGPYLPVGFNPIYVQHAR